MANVSLKLVVDKLKNRVIFAECNKDFVDILFSFLTLPMGTIVRLLGKKSEVGCMDKLYESVENLDTKYLQTEACKLLLLWPRSESERQCKDLAINVDDLDPRILYRCPNWYCFTKIHCLYSMVPGALCRCGEAMLIRFEWVEERGGNADGVFVKGESSFIISDDLHVTPISTDAILSSLQRFGIQDADALQNRIVDLSKNQILSLLKRTLLSKTPLTDVFLRMPDSMNLDSETVECELIGTSQINIERDPANESRTISLRLLKSKSTGNVLYAEAGESLVDTLLSFLTFPLGSIVKLLNKHSSLGCVDNLYQSVEVLSLDGYDYIKSHERKNMLLEPKLSPHFGCTNQLLRIYEKTPPGFSARGCEICFEEDRDECDHGEDDASITMINPKLPYRGTKHGGGFAKSSVKFVVTNEMVVMPLSSTFGIDAVKELRVPFASLVEREITCGEREVLNLLKACLIHRNKVLSNVFPSKKRRRMS